MDIQYARMGDLGGAFTSGLQNAQMRQNMAQLRWEQDQRNKALREEETIKNELNAGLQKFGSYRGVLENIHTSPYASQLFPIVSKMAQQEYETQAMPINTELAKLSLEAKKKELSNYDEKKKIEDINKKIFIASLEKDPLKRKMMFDQQGPKTEYEAGIPTSGSPEQLRAYALGPEEYTRNFLKEGVGLNFEEKMALEQQKSQSALQRENIRKALREQDLAIKREALKLKGQEFGLKSEDQAREFAKQDADLQSSIDVLTAKNEKFKGIRATVSDIYNNEELWANAGFGQLGAKIPESKAADIKAKLEYALNSLLPDAVKEAKDAGATFGAMTQAEWEQLKTSIANLDPNQSPDSYRANVGLILDKLDNSLILAAKDISRKKNILNKTTGKTNPKDPLGLGF